MNNLEQLSLFDEEFEYTKTCDTCGRVWTSFSPFDENWECPGCKRENYNDCKWSY